MKKTVLVIVVLIVLMLCCSPACAFADVINDLEQEVSNGIDKIDFSKVDEIGFDFIGSVADKVKKIISGEYDDAQTFLQLLVSLMSDGLKSLLPELSAIFVVMVIMGLIRKTSGGLISQGTDDVVSFVGLAVVLMSVLSLIVRSYRQVYELLFKVGTIAEVSMPILLTLILANGGNTISSVCQPSMIMFSTVVIKVVQNIIMPLSIFALIFAIVSNFSSNVKVGKMSSFLTSSSTWILGIVFMIYSAFTSVQGISAMAIDGVSFRAAKFATKSYIPILGGYLADGFDMVVASTSLIKNAFGAVTLLILLLTVAQPLISILCVNLGLQGVAAICEPIVDEKYVRVLGGVSKTLTFLAVLICAVAFMLCILVLIAITCANGVL